jgi:hypothetical protein
MISYSKPKSFLPTASSRFFRRVTQQPLTLSLI